MLRYVLRIHRRRVGDSSEEWPDFMKRAAAVITETGREYGLVGWVTTHRRRKWQLAGKLARATDDRWSHHILKWQPQHGHGRSVGRPRTRWTDPLEALAGGDWMTLARDVSQWDAAEDVFASA